MKALNIATTTLILSLLSACGPLANINTSGPIITAIDRAKDMQVVLTFNDCVAEGQRRDAAAGSERYNEGPKRQQQTGDRPAGLPSGDMSSLAHPRLVPKARDR